MRTPNEVAQSLIKLADQLRLATHQVGELDAEARRAKSRFEVSYAKAFINAEGSMEIRKQLAVLETANAKLDAELAEAKLRAEQENLRYLRSSIEVGRTLSATVRSEWEATAVAS